MYSFTVNNQLIEVISETEILVGDHVFNNMQDAVDSTKTEIFTKAEKALLLRFLDELNEHYSNAGCNDFEIEASPENIEIANKILETDEDSCVIKKDSIFSMDSIWLNYMVKKIENA